MKDSNWLWKPDKMTRKLLRSGEKRLREISERAKEQHTTYAKPSYKSITECTVHQNYEEGPNDPF